MRSSTCSNRTHRRRATRTSRIGACRTGRSFTTQKILTVWSKSKRNTIRTTCSTTPRAFRHGSLQGRGAPLPAYLMRVLCCCAAASRGDEPRPAVHEESDGGDNDQHRYDATDGSENAWLVVSGCCGASRNLRYTRGFPIE